MSSRFFAVTALAAAHLSVVPGVGSAQAASTGPAQSFPSKPIRIVTGLPGGGSDIIGRLVSQGLATGFGQPVLVDNRPGGVVPGEIVSRATPDGYTLLLLASGLWLGQFFSKNVPYDPIRDFAPVTITTNAPNALVVHPSVQATTVKDLIALAKAKPGSLNASTAANASSSHLAFELFKFMAGVNIVRIPYKGNVPALNDLMGGQVQLSFASAASVTPHLKSGRLRALAATSLEPSPVFPGLPTVSASGLPGFETGTITGIFAPAKTPGAIVNRLNQEIVRVLTAQDARDKLFTAGIDVVASSPAQASAKIKSEIATWGKVIKASDMRAE